MKRNHENNQRGQSIVETAMVLPLIVLVLAGIMDFGFLFNNYLVISNASREGARLAAVGLSDSNVMTSITNITGSINQSKISITISPSESYRKRGDEISVTVEYSNTILTPIVSSIIPNPIKLKSKTVMRIE